MTVLLDIENLRVRVPGPRGRTEILRGLDLTLRQGDRLGIVGESGSGKSMTALAIMGLLPEGAEVSGNIRFEGRPLPVQDEKAMCALRGNRIAMIFQEPMTALNPLHRIGAQIAEPLLLHKSLSRVDARDEALRLLDRVGIPNARQRLDAYPHQLSGGQRQRVAIAMALACKPKLLIADEPTTALDVTIQKQVLNLIAELVESENMGLIIVSHDLALIAENATRIAVMYGGTIVERSATEALFTRRAHPYTQGLFNARPKLGRRSADPLPVIKGNVPDFADFSAGCPFAGRCPQTFDRCYFVTPPPVEVGQDHVARCLLFTSSHPDGQGRDS
ncbi:ABC transporter ATP-binding protein [Methylovirgula sp. 4M-Z18]|uniref:ABC transporter ATP-binding protein n=1 Tax=Methylovirgula sp. 4M-Z18 TaxID=2293567 RepID=UPI000E2FEBF2|nr:ABC transporter ATP-binding protein [Methylovirgula sp. 4M-Z18]RFB81281.1 ABC transporter ATP-binding protein [Methylovirgula sp. 4M-Z18]